MPYRTLRVLSHDRQPETFVVRVDDRAVIEWLAERAGLRRRGYPDRPPDIDTPTLRAWLPRLGEQTLPYFRDQPARVVRGESGIIFPVLTMTWHRPNGFTTKIILTGLGDGSFVNRVCIVDDSGNRSVDKAHRLGPDVDPNAVWAEIETIVRAINEAPMGWQPRDPMVTTYADFLALDEQVDAAEAEARAAGLLAPEWVH